MGKINYEGYDLAADTVNFTVHEIKVQKVTEDRNKQIIPLYYKNSDGVIEEVPGKVAKPDFLKELLERVTEKHSNIISKETTTTFYIHKDFIDEKIAFFLVLMEGNNKKRYFELLIKKIKELDRFLEGEYLPIVDYSLAGFVSLTDEAIIVTALSMEDEIKKN